MGIRMAMVQEMVQTLIPEMSRGAPSEERNGQWEQLSDLVQHPACVHTS